MSISLQVSGRRPRYDLVASVSGLPADTSATVTIASTLASRLGTDDPRCSSGLGNTYYVCEIEPGGSTILRLVATAPLGGIVSAEVSTGMEDPDPTNNRDVAVMGRTGALLGREPV